MESAATQTIPLEDDDHRQALCIVTAGHVDHGKSTILGRLLADSELVPEEKLEAIRALCERNSRPFEYAFLLDAFKDERLQGITIDAARVFFRHGVRRYLFVDAPGHMEFLRNMITGASRADTALLVLDAEQGVCENSKRHAYLLSLIGIRRVALLVNKMDLVSFAEEVFQQHVAALTTLGDTFGLEFLFVIPLSGRTGDNIVHRSTQMPWYRGPTLLEALGKLEGAPSLESKPFRMFVQDVYKFTNAGDSRRIVAGTIASGTVSVGDEIVFYPSGKQALVKTIENFGAPTQHQAQAGDAVGLTLSEQLYVTRGNLLSLARELRPRVSTRFRSTLFWLGKRPLRIGEEYVFRIGTHSVSGRVEQVLSIFDPVKLESFAGVTELKLHDIADCVIALRHAATFDEAAVIFPTGRFVVVSDYRICGGGIIREGLPDDQDVLREKALVRNAKWVHGLISSTDREERYGHLPALVIVTSANSVDRKAFAAALEAKFFAAGRFVYFLGIGNVLYGIDADIKHRDLHHDEHIRRLGEVAHLMLDAGMLLFAVASELHERDIDVIRTVVDPERVVTIWVGSAVTTDLQPDILIHDLSATDEAAEKIEGVLAGRGSKRL